MTFRIEVPVTDKEYEEKSNADFMRSILKLGHNLYVYYHLLSDAWGIIVFLYSVIIVLVIV